MGNNKGRSKGCVTCLKRRVKCDQTRPTCTRCSKAKFACQGYRETLFIDGMTQVQTRLNTQSIRSRKAESSEAPDGQDKLAVVEAKASGCTQLQSRSSYSQNPYSWSHLSVSPWKDDIVLAYLVADQGPIGTIFCKLGSSPRAATKECFLALATTFYGVGHAEESIVASGRRLYSRALTMLNEDMSDLGRPRMAELLSSVFALTLQETIAPTINGGHKWVHHVQGLEQLLAAHGPVTDASDPIVQDLIDATRMIMISVSLFTHRPSLMSRSAWKAAKIGLSATDSTLPKLLDVLAQLPTLYSKRDELLFGSPREVGRVTDGTITPDQSSGAQSLLDATMGLLDDIRVQRTQLMNSHPESEFPGLPSTDLYSKRPYPCRVVTHFSSPHAANFSTFYNSLRILLNQLLVSLHQLLDTKNRGTFSIEVASEEISVSTIEILKTVDYHLRYTLTPPRSQVLGAESPNFYFIFPMHIVYDVISHSELPDSIAQQMWLKDIFSYIRNRIGPWASSGQVMQPD